MDGSVYKDKILFSLNSPLACRNLKITSLNTVHKWKVNPAFISFSVTFEKNQRTESPHWLRIWKDTSNGWNCESLQFAWIWNSIQQDVNQLRAHGLRLNCGWTCTRFGDRLNTYACNNFLFTCELQVCNTATTTKWYGRNWRQLSNALPELDLLKYKGIYTLVLQNRIIFIIDYRKIIRRCTRFMNRL